jgi:hypothetical protein
MKYTRLEKIKYKEPSLGGWINPLDKVLLLYFSTKVTYYLKNKCTHGFVRSSVEVQERITVNDADYQKKVYSFLYTRKYILYHFFILKESIQVKVFSVVTAM